MSVEVSEVGAAACDDGLASKATEEWSTDALHSANSNKRSPGFKYIRWCPCSALLRNYSGSVAKGMFIFLGQNIHFVKGHGVGKGVE